MGESIPKPSVLLTLLEARAGLELGAHILSRHVYEKRLPKGKGRPVLVIPGFGADDLSTLVLRRSLNRLGYQSFGWGMGRNMGSTAKNREHLHAELDRLYSASGQKVSVIGWSLGGIYARELGRNYPQYVHSVFSMGSPFGGDPKANILHDIFHRLSGAKFSNEDQAAFDRRKVPPGVPCTAIHSKTDGVVAWQCSLEQEAESTKNIEVFSSHCGLGFNPLVISVLAKELQY